MSIKNWIKGLFQSKPKPFDTPVIPNVMTPKLDKKPDAPKAKVADEKAGVEWMPIAYKEVGVTEIAGPNDNKRVIQYHQTCALKATHDEVPWCSAFVNFVFFCLLWKRTKSAAAASWLSWGIKLEKPRFGCVAVKSRKGGNHVTFFVRYENRNGAEGFIGLGGNQGNKVCEAWYPLSSVIGWRWPTEAAALLKDGAAA